MKTITFLAAAFLLSANTISASGGIFSGENTKTHFNFDEPITFTERGIAFYVFANGEFDFNTADLNDPSIFYKDGAVTTKHMARLQTKASELNTMLLVAFAGLEMCS